MKHAIVEMRLLSPVVNRLLSASKCIRTYMAATTPDAMMFMKYQCGLGGMIVAETGVQSAVG
jgi:hypothetical protein